MIEFIADVTSILKQYKIKSVITPTAVLDNGIEFENSQLVHFDTPVMAADFIEHMLKY